MNDISEQELLAEKLRAIYCEARGIGSKPISEYTSDNEAWVQVAQWVMNVFEPKQAIMIDGTPVPIRFDNRVAGISWDIEPTNEVKRKLVKEVLDELMEGITPLTPAQVWRLTHEDIPDHK